MPALRQGHVRKDRTCHGKLLRERNLPFGISTCWTSANDRYCRHRGKYGLDDTRGGAFLLVFLLYAGRPQCHQRVYAHALSSANITYRFIREMREKAALLPSTSKDDGEFGVARISRRTTLPTYQRERETSSRKRFLFNYP